MIKHYLKMNLSVSSFLILQCLFALLVFLLNAEVFADGFRQGRVFIGADLGAAQSYLQRGSTQYDDGWLYGSLWAEYGVSEQVLLGVEGAGWTDQGKVNDPIAEDVMALMMTAKVYPWLTSGFYVKTGWGYMKHRYWEASPLADSAGPSYLVGLGFPLGTGVLQVSYTRAALSQGNFRAITVNTSFPLYISK